MATLVVEFKFGDTKLGRFSVKVILRKFGCFLNGIMPRLLSVAF